MSETKWTPGPIVVEQDPDNAGKLVCHEKLPHHSVWPGEALYLPATPEREAAEELVKALEAVDAAWFEDVPGGPDDPKWAGIGEMVPAYVDLWRQIRAALSKARGE